jgi:serine/threonine protein kinase
MQEHSPVAKLLIGPYHLSRLIGVGPVSRTHLAERQDGSEVVFKLFEVAPLHSLEERDQVLDEVRLRACLEHPAILPILDDGTHEKILYLVTSYAAGGSLRQRLNEANGELLPLKEVLSILRQVGEALHFAHGQGVVHATSSQRISYFKRMARYYWPIFFSRPLRSPSEPRACFQPLPPSTWLPSNLQVRLLRSAINTRWPAWPMNC